MRARLADVALGALALALLSGSVGLVHNRASREPLPVLAPFRVAIPAGTSTLDLGTARTLLESGDALFLDARELERYQEGHIPGALSLPADDLEAYAGGRAWETLLFTLRVTPHVVVYCDGPECLASQRLAGDLVKAGLRNVSVLTDGWPGWEAAGYPAVREVSP